MSWYELQSLLAYHDEHPPVHILLQGLVSGMSGTDSSSIRKTRSALPVPEPKRIQSGEELVGILRSSGINFGVIHGGG